MVRNKKVDANTKRAIVYMQDAASNRGIKSVDADFFVYSIMRSCGDYIEQYLPADEMEKVTTAIGDIIEDRGDGKRIRVDEITYAPEISKYVSKIESEELPGVISIMADIVSNDPKVSSIFEDNNIFNHDLVRASKFEVARKNTSSKGKRTRAKKRGGGPAIGGGLMDIGMAMPVQRKSEKGDLEGFCTDLTALAKEGKIGNVFCREYEIGKVITSLLRKIKSNPLLIGEPGVGKTAIVEGLAARIASGDVPEKLKESTVMALDVSSVVGGTTLRGEFEERMKHIMVELTERKDVILFIDEIHMIVGAGDHTGSMDAGNILKPYLARGDIKCIGATTHYEYNKHMKKDGALVRRFQRVSVDELSDEQTFEIMSGIAPSFEKFHDVDVSEEALKAIIRLSGKHIADRYMPDKAIDCLDEACARAVILDQDVCKSLVEEAMADLAAVPVSIIRQSTADMKANMLSSMKDSILGNDDAIEELCKTISSRSSSISIGNRPLCAAILKGQSGIGKKSCVRLAAKSMFGSRDSIVELDGADYSEPHSVSKIIGSPPGYVGYSEEGILKDVRVNPHSIVMIVGFGNMHPAVREQMIKIVRDGKIKDSQGNTIDFRSTTVIFVVDEPKTKSLMGFNDDSDSSLNVPLDPKLWKSVIDNVDSIIEFSPVEESMLVDIAKLEVECVKRLYKSSGFDFPGFSDEEVDRVLEEISPCSPSEVRRKIRNSIEMKTS